MKSSLNEPVREIVCRYTRRGTLGKLVKVNYYHETARPTKKLTGRLP